MEPNIYEEWIEKYKPVQNPKNRPEDGNEYEWDTHEDIEYIRKVCAETPDRVWTFIDDNSGWYGVVAGWHYINRMAYAVTEIPWQDSNESYTIYDNTELREQWESLPIKALEEVTQVLSGRTDEEMGEYRDEWFWQWEEIGEVERDKIIKKYTT